MKICLVNPPVRDFYTTSVRRQPLGLLYIASCVRERGHDVALVNGHSPKHSDLPLPSFFDYLRPFIDHPDRQLRFPFPLYRHYGMSFQEMTRRIKSTQPDMVMVSSLFTPYHHDAEELMKIARDVCPGAVIVAGGHHPTLHPEYLLSENLADFIIAGEGEVPAARLADVMENGGSLNDVPGLVWMDKGTIHRNKLFHPDIDDLPFPARDLLSRRDFSFYRTKMVSILAGRGCPHNCAFCTARSVFGAGRRSRHTESIIAEIEQCVDHYETNVINFEDDNIFADKSRAEDLLNSMADFRKKKNKELDLTAMNGISIEHVDDSIIGLMADAGFREINISLVSASREVQKSSGRPFDSNRFSHVVNAAKKMDLNIRAYFILGLPDQTGDEIEQTISFLENMNVQYFPSVYYDVTSPRNEWAMQRSSAFYNETEHLKREDLVRWFNRCSR